MDLVAVLLSFGFWFFCGWKLRGYLERRKAWRRGLYEHSQLHQDDDNPPGSL